MKPSPLPSRRRMITIYMDPQIKAAIDMARGKDPRSVWIERAALEKLNREKPVTE